MKKGLEQYRHLMNVIKEKLYLVVNYTNFRN